MTDAHDDVLGPIRRRVEAAKGMTPWVAPPQELTHRTAPARSSIAIPPPRSDRRVLRLVTDGSDLRGAQTTAAAAAEVGGSVGGQMIAGEFELGEIGLFVASDPGDRRWRFEGTIWLDVPAIQPIRIFLLHQDHVLFGCTVVSGERFEFDEYAPAGWILEIYFAGDEVLTIPDPTP